jgi:hypothetical protein
VQDAGEDVDVTVRWYVREVARPVDAAPAEPGGLHGAARRFEDVRAFEQDTVQAWVGGEDAAEQGPVPARDVDDGPAAGRVAGGRDDGSRAKWSKWFSPKRWSKAASPVRRV